LSGLRIDFYQLGQTPLEDALPQLVAKMRDAGARVLVVFASAARRARIGEALWAWRDSFLAHGAAGEPHQERQPILLAESLEPVNGANYLALADGEWREEAERFERVFLLFDSSTIEAARLTWRSLDGREQVERNYWRQEQGGWVKAG